MRGSSPRGGFSLTESLAAIVILTVVSAATIATVAPMRARAGRVAGEQQLAELNRHSQAYLAEHGELPPNGVVSLIQAGMIPGSESAGILQNFTYSQQSGRFSRR